MAATKRPTRFFVIIPRDIRELLVPKRSEAFGLYAQLADAVTCNVPHGTKKFGLVFGGASKSQREWAKLFRMTERSFQRVLGILKKENLVVVHRGQHDTKIAVIDSLKKTKRRGTIAGYPWLLLGLAEPPNMAELNTNSEPPNMAELSANVAGLSANMAELNESKTAQPVGDAMSYGEQDGREERTEERTEEIPRKLPMNSAASAAENQPSASPGKFTYYPEDFAANDDNRALASKLGLDIEESLEAFEDYHIHKGDRSRDWNRALNGWLRNEKRWGRTEKPKMETFDALAAFRAEQ